MLGDTVGEVRGQAISTRILPDEGQGPRMEITDQSAGELYGVSVNQTVTYVGVLRPNGTISGEGIGITMTADGESATFRGYGVGKFTPAAFLLATIVLTVFSVGYAAMASRVSSVAATS